MPSPHLFRTSQASADLDAIWDYIARDSPAAADRILDELNERFMLLTGYPELGELQPSLADGTYRRFAHRNFVIYYRPTEDGIVLVRILHGAQDHEELL